MISIVRRGVRIHVNNCIASSAIMVDLSAPFYFGNASDCTTVLVWIITIVHKLLLFVKRVW